MCPVANEINDNIRHDIVRKIGLKKSQNNLKKVGNSAPAESTFYTQSVNCLLSRTLPEHPILSPSYSTLNLSILSSVRLVL
jgi:hypothetical protein